MPDTTIEKVESASSPRGEMGQRYLVAGKRVSMRLWVLEPGSKIEPATSRDCTCSGRKKEARSSGFRKVSVLNRDRCL
jgi:hypothetical protein